MGDTRYSGRLRVRSPRFEVIALLLGLAIIVSQAIGVVAAAADGIGPSGLTSLSSGATNASAEDSTKDASGSKDGSIEAATAEETKAGATSASPSKTEVQTATNSLNVDLDQYANDDAKWQNGDLNGNNSAYNEGDVVPFRLAIEGLRAGTHSIHINYDFTAGGIEAYDFLATWNATEHPGLCDAGGGAISSMCPGLGGADAKAFPSDPFEPGTEPGSDTQSGLTVAGAEAFSGVPRALTLYGGTITSITGPTHDGPVGGNSTGDFVVTFEKVGTNGAVLLAWGGHLAESAYWKNMSGENNGASIISGAPWHMRTQQLDGSGNKNQDRSIQPSAILPLPGLAIEKSASSSQVGPGDAFTYTIVVTNTGDATASPVVITDDLDDSLTGVSATYDIDPGSGQDGTCTVGAGNTISCPSSGTISLTKSDGDLVAPENDVVAVTITATAPSDSCPTLLNTASAQLGTDTPITSNQVTVDVTGCAVDVTVTKDASDTDVNAGDQVTFTIVATNGGTTTATDVQVADTLDADLTTVGTPTWSNGGSSGNCGVAGQIVICDVGDLGPGESATVTIAVTATVGACPSVDNTATVSSTNEDQGSTDNDTSAPVTINVTCPTSPPPPAPLGIQIIKSGPAMAHVGDTITYALDVSLTTSTPLTGITVTDPICTAAPTLDAKGGGDQDAWLEPGETWHYSCTHDVTATDPDPLPNTATVTGTDNTGRDTSDTDDHLVDIIHPAIRIVKTANPLSIAPGETVTYTYKVTNIGDVTLYGVSLDDDKLGHICDIAQLAVGETQTCTKDFTAGTDNLGPLKNVAVAEGEDETGYPVRDDDKASIDVVLGTTVTPTTTPPSGTAFTGSNQMPLGAIALVLLVVGTGLLYVGRRREDGSGA
jgi:uncharacterized repeat protein (TIGR01451 family)